MRRLVPAALLSSTSIVAFLAVAACGSNATETPVAALDGAPTTNDPDGGGGPGDTEGGATTDGGGPIADASPVGAWDGSFSGPLTCTGGGAFTANYTGSCGVERWAIKTGADPGAPAISLLPKLTTVAALGAIPVPGSIPFSTRVKPSETTVFAVKDVKLTFVRLEDDGDYHLVLTDGTSTMISEIPYPGGSCTTGSAWQCLISKARAAVDAKLPGLQLLKGKVESLVVSVAGVGFFDTEHSQFGAAPNAIEMHPVLEICFGTGCSLSP